MSGAAQEGVTEEEMVVLDESGGCEEGMDVVDKVVEGQGGKKDDAGKKDEAGKDEGRKKDKAGKENEATQQ